MTSKKTNNRRFLLYLIIVGFIFSALIFALHKPLPPGFTHSKLDRLTIHVIEPVLRAVYYYPSRFFTKPSDMVWWTRNSLNGLARLIGPITIFDDSLNIKNQQWNGVPVRVYYPKDNVSRTDGAIVFIHGGGFALGNVEMYDSLARRISKSMKTFVVSVEYRLAPETPFPGGLHDCEKAVDYIFKNGNQELGINTRRIVVMGDSAGGNLATAIVQRRVQRDVQPPIAGQVLLYPLLQLVDLQTISYRFFHEKLSGFALVDPESVVYYYMFYAGINMDEKKYLVPFVLSNGHIMESQHFTISRMMSYEKVIASKPNYNNTLIPNRWPVKENLEAQHLLESFLLNPDFSPLMREDLSKMPKSLVITCEYDVLRDEGIIYAERLKAGVDVTAINYKHGFHAMLNMHNEVTEASNCLEDVMKWTSDNLIKS